MIDLLKIRIPADGKEFTLPKGSPLEIYAKVNRNTGELLEGCFGKKDGLSFWTKYNGKFPKYYFIKVSLHKMYNDFQHNHNSFLYTDLMHMIESLCSWFGIATTKMQIIQLEFGMNLRLSFEPNYLLDNLVLCHRNAFVLRNKNSFTYKQAELSKMWFKVYNKGEQHKLGYNVLRIENKYQSTGYYRKIGIYTVEDLKDVTKLQQLKNDLFAKWNKCIIFEPPIHSPNNILTENQYLKWQNLKYWMNLTTQYRNKFSRQRKLFDKYINEKTLNRQKDIPNLMRQEWTKFINSEKVQISPLDITEKCTFKDDERKCIVTGIDISHQRKDSKFISEKTIAEIETKDIEQFNRLCSQFLDPNGSYLTANEILYYIAHNVRNQHWNKRYRINVLTCKYENSLFPIEDEHYLS